ncbi:Glycosidase [Paenibacillus sp. ov031]|uniref:alpha-amylase family glycosyl hydrolase n=1 Tax=Paenibacillus sp. ov031 TaxID=1761879 RepID=UPI0009127E70|nr:alpha-amylase family glycosyl hydrolase [Paenibacillus sp. ov031]SHN80738.1 Glycosidase [Paenibacillus sp. ov031]
MFKWTKRIILSTTLSFSLLAGSALPLFPAASVFADADTAVSNKQNFSTDVIYQVFTDRFLDGNPSNNPTGGAYDASCSNLKLYCGGDWQGLINKINDNYFSDLGITALWISQPVENIYSLINYSGVNNTAYHGYWARDFKKTNPAFGTMTDFQNLINTAHAKGIKVIIDFAPNHTSPAMETDTSFAENGKLYNNGTLLGGYTNDTNKLFHHNGGSDFSTLENGIYKNLYDLADLNHNNSTIDTYFKDAIKLWLDMGIDGIRVDAVKHMPMGWQKNWMSSIYGYKPVFTFGEWFLGSSASDADNTNFANQSGMSLLDFRFNNEVRNVFRDNTSTMVALDSMITSTAADYAQVNDQVTFIDNHDMDRFKTSAVNNRRLEQALAFTLTSRGVPAIYYGTEQYLTGNGDPNNRAKMPSFSKTTTAFNVISKLAPLRKTNPAIAYGTTQQRWINNDVYVYERKFGNNVAVVAVNRNLSTSTSISGLTTSLPSGTYNDVLAGALSGNNITSTGGNVANFTLAAGATAVWQYTANTTTPTIGHVGPVMGKAGNTVTIDGRGFGTTKGTVYFGTTAVTGSAITSWEDTQIKVTIPAVAAGNYAVKVAASGVNSNTYNNFTILSGNQVSVRFVINNASTTLGQNLYLTGNVAELGNWSTGPLAIGPVFNQVIYSYPTWYYDVSVPAGTNLEFKFFKKNGSTITWENGNNHTFTTPTSGTATVTVDWQP